MDSISIEIQTFIIQLILTIILHVVHVHITRTLHNTQTNQNNNLGSSSFKGNFSTSLNIPSAVSIILLTSI